MTLLINVVPILYVGIAAAWFGHKLMIPADIPASLDEREAAESLVERLHRAETLGIVTGLGTPLTGLAPVVMLGP